MANTLLPKAVVQLTASFAIIYTVPGSTIFTVTMLHIVNTTGVARDVYVCLVPSAGSPLQENALLWKYPLPPYGFMEFDAGDEWLADSTLRARSDAALSVNLKLAGIETV